MVQPVTVRRHDDSIEDFQGQPEGINSAQISLDCGQDLGHLRERHLLQDPCLGEKPLSESVSIDQRPMQIYLENICKRYGRREV
ncbi:hypothetical protein, partial [Synechococcus sp. R55.7]|uniref:hypothetical protein n=1 Tax=Synechococcus sp. R55.7 TaxID=2964500 RepID=UPI0039C2802E